MCETSSPCTPCLCIPQGHMAERHKCAGWWCCKTSTCIRTHRPGASRGRLLHCSGPGPLRRSARWACVHGSVALHVRVPAALFRSAFCFDRQRRGIHPRCKAANSSATTAIRTTFVSSNNAGLFFALTLSSKYLDCGSSEYTTSILLTLTLCNVLHIHECKLSITRATTCLAVAS